MKIMCNTMDDGLRNPVIKENRKMTDKYGLLLLITIFLIWVTSCGYVIYNELYPTVLTPSLNNTQINQSEFKQYFMNNKWLFDILTYEFELCDEWYECNFIDGVLNPMFHFGWYHIGIMGVPTLILCFLRFLERKHYMTFYTGLIVISMGFIAVSVAYHIALNFVSDFIPQRLCYKSFVFWFAPEFILFLLILITVIRMLDIDPNCACQTLKRTFRWCCKMYCAILFAVFLVVIMIAIKILTVGLIAVLSWTDILLYVIFVGSCYIAFFIYNFGNAVITTFIWNSINENKGPFKTLLQSIILVSRYHLGSVAIRTTIVLPLLVISRERSNIKQTIEANIEKTYGMRILSELEKSKDNPSSEVKYYKTFPPRPFSPMDGLPIARYCQNHYTVQVFKSSLMFVVVHGLSFRDSIKAILLRHSMDQQLPSSTVFVYGFPLVYFLLCMINEVSRYFILPFNMEAYNVPHFDLIGVVAYFKIAVVMFLLGMMLMNNFELTFELFKIETKEKSQQKNEQTLENVKKVVSV